MGEINTAHHAGDRPQTGAPTTQPASSLALTAPLPGAGHPRPPEVMPQTTDRAGILIALDVEALLTAESVGEIERAVQQGVVCAICELGIRHQLGDRASVLALQDPNGRLWIRFAHERCAPSRLIKLDHVPTPALDAATDRSSRSGGLTWALSARRRLLPTVALVCDVDCLEALDVRGGALLAAMRLDGLRGGCPLQQITPATTDAISASRQGASIVLEFAYGTEALALDALEHVYPALQVAARQQQLLVVFGQSLALGPGYLQETDRQLSLDQAIAACVHYSDPELAGIRLRRRRISPAARRLARTAGWTR